MRPCGCDWDTLVNATAMTETTVTNGTVRYLTHRLLPPCGCATWLQFENGQWVPKSWRCLLHDRKPA